MAPTTTFDDLNDDCIRLVIEEAARLSEGYWHDPTALQSLSLLNKRIRYLCLPVLFKSKQLSLSADSRAEPTVQTFSALVQAEFRSSTLQAISVTLNNPTVAKDAAFCNSLVTAVAAMPNLMELHLDFCHNEDLCSKLRVAFIANHLVLPVKILRLSQAPNAAFVVQACQSLETFIAARLNRKWKRTFAPLLSLATLRRLEIETEENLTARRLQDLIPYMKHVPELCLKGELYKIKTTALAAQFKDLNRLRSLTMTSLQWINHRKLPPYLYHDDVEDEQVFHLLYETTHKIAQAYFEICPKLQNLRVLHSFGTDEYGCVRGKEEAVSKIEFQGEISHWYGFKSVFQNLWPMVWW